MIASSAGIREDKENYDVDSTERKGAPPMRKRFLRFWPRNLILSWLLSYVLILCIPITISLAFYQNAYSVIKGEIMRANVGLLKQVQQDVDGRLQEIRQLSTQLTFHAEEQGMMYWEQPLTDTQRYMIAKTQQTFRTYAASGSFIDSFQLYLQRAGYVLTNSSAYSDVVQFHEQTYGDAGMSLDAWQAVMNTRYTGQFILLRQTGETVGREPEPMVSFVRSLPLSNPTSTLATLVVSVQEAKLREMIRAVQDVNQGTALILDADLQPIVSAGPMDPEKLDRLLSALDRTPEGKTHTDARLDGEDVVLNRVVSDTTEWQYISVIPYSVFWEKAERIRSWSIAGLAICLLLGSFSAYYMSRRQYHPVGEIMQLVSGKVRLTMEQHRNEYHFIHETLRHSFHESEYMQHQLKQQSIALRSNFLFRLLKGRLESSYPVEEALNAYDLRFRYDRFAVAVFYIEDFSELFKDSAEEADEEKRIKFVQHIVRNIAEELANKTYAGYMTDYDDGMMALLLNVPGDAEADAVRRAVLEVAAEAQRFIAGRFYIHHTVSVSRVHAGIPGIHAAYAEAMDALEYKMVIGTNRVIEYEQLQTPDPMQTYYYPLEKEQHLINAIKTGSADRAMETLNEIVAVNMALKAVPIEVFRCFLFDLVGTIMKTLNEIQFPDKRHFLQRWDPVTKLLKLETIQDMQREMGALLQEACEWMDENKKSRNTGLYDRVLQVIDEQYRNSNLNLAVIAEELGVSSGYLSRFFKEQHGEGLLDALNQVRLKKAKELLAEGKRTVAEIAETVGYYNSNAFIRVFKKYEGVTPGQYKGM